MRRSRERWFSQTTIKAVQEVCSLNALCDLSVTTHHERYLPHLLLTDIYSDSPFDWSHSSTRGYRYQALVYERLERGVTKGDTWRCEWFNHVPERVYFKLIESGKVRQQRSVAVREIEEMILRYEELQREQRKVKPVVKRAGVTVPLYLRQFDALQHNQI